MSHASMRNQLESMFELNENGNITYQNLWDTTKIVFRKYIKKFPKNYRNFYYRN